MLPAIYNPTKNITFSILYTHINVAIAGKELIKSARLADYLTYMPKYVCVLCDNLFPA